MHLADSGTHYNSWLRAPAMYESPAALCTLFWCRWSKPCLLIVSYLLKLDAGGELVCVGTSVEALTEGKTAGEEPELRFLGPLPVSNVGSIGLHALMMLSRFGRGQPRWRQLFRGCLFSFA